MTEGEVIIEADGGSRGNPGPAGYGAVVFDSDHVSVLAERKESLGTATNNVAEYRGLIAGLEAAAELGAGVLAVRLDSKLVVEQMSGRWKVKHEALIPLADRARRLVAGFDRVRFQWIPRSQNSHADRLANAAMDDAPLVDEVRSARAAGHRSSDEVSPSRGTAGSSAAGSAEESKAGANSGASPEVAGADPVADSRSAAVAATGAPGWSGATGRPTRLLLLRHGQTELSVQRRYSGRGDPALTELGQEQAARAAKMLAAKGDIETVVTSPLGRARDTARAAGGALDLPVRVLDGLIETDFGEWEGLTFSEAAERDPELHGRWLGDSSLAAPGGESFDQVRARIEETRRDLLASYPGANIVLVSHVTPIKTLLQLALGVGPSLLYRLHLDLASLSIVEWYPDGNSSVRLVNDTSYL